MIVPQAVEELVEGPQCSRLQDKVQRDVVSSTDMQQLADQLRQELSQRVTTDTDTTAVGQLRAEMTAGTNIRIDQLSSIASAMQNLSAKAPSAAKPYEVRDLCRHGKETSREENS